jgi:hypothetical protein
MKKGFSKTEIVIAIIAFIALYGIALADFVENVRFYPIAANLNSSGVQTGGDSVIVKLYSDSGIVYLSFDADSITDYSGNHMRGTGIENASAAGVANSSTAEAGDGSLNLTYTAGTDSGYLVIPDVLQHLRSTIEGTWSVWVKPGYVADTMTVISFSDSAEKEKVALQIQPNAIVKAILMDSTGQGTGKVHWACSTTAAIDTTAWTLLTLTHNNTTPLLYVNGALDTAKFMVSTSKTSWFDSLSMLDEGFIGCEAYDSLGHIHFYSGLLDEVIIEKRAWTAAEIAAYYTLPSDYNDSHSLQPENVSDYIYLPQLDIGYTAARRALSIQDLYGWFVLGMRATDTTGTPPNIRWVVQGKDTTDGNTWTDISDTGYSHATVTGITHFNDIDTLKGFISRSIIERVPAQFRIVAISDSPNVSVVRPNSATYQDVRFRTTE